MNIFNKIKEYKEERRKNKDAQREIQAKTAAKEIKRQKVIMKQEATIKEAKELAFNNSTIGKAIAKVKETRSAIQSRNKKRGTKRTSSAFGGKNIFASSGKSSGNFYSSKNGSAADFYRK